PEAVIARGRAYRAAGNLDAARADFEAARALGGDAVQIERHVASLSPRVQNPEATVPPGYRWSARISASRTSFSPDRDGWDDQELSLRHHFTRGSLALELLRAERFGRDDTAWALDAYTPLWNRAYANLRYQSGGGLLPDQSWRAEVFQGVGRGWELSGSYDHLDFGSGTDLYGVGVGRYVGNYYMRYKALYVGGSGNVSHRGTLRNYYEGNGDDYVEITAGTGRSNEVGDGQFDRSLRRSKSSLGVAWVKYFHPQWGFKLGANYANDVDGFDERRINASLYSRW
ncbi:MAG: YaiO family outer membrane beta-barrel protein, partial [Pseudomonadota bacterium]|nr:YaiO family outer membrane beta-barrel protein [Pseudomonadota bacterium]